ncbi:MAG: dihydrofolate reductase family protein [Ancrocorticia sp.]|uniref:dihydrofolate reductase family protein n=1 Tax=Ancrocorticia sp. TaxID=2593684 RepID=UPI003F915A6F
MELMIDFITSLDGYAAAEGWPGWWGLEGPEYLGWLGEDAENQAALLMGANTYRSLRPYVGDSMDDTPKFVFSQTLTEPLEWRNTTLVRDDAATAVRELKRTSDRPLSTIGSLSLARSLMSAGLVDHFRVVVFPVITGKTGRERIYDGYPDVALELTESRVFDNGTHLLDYRPRLLDAPLPPGPGSA